MAFSSDADVIKLTDEEAEWLFGVPGDEALRDPSMLTGFFPSAKVRGRAGAVKAFGCRGHRRAGKIRGSRTVGCSLESSCGHAPTEP